MHAVNILILPYLNKNMKLVNKCHYCHSLEVKQISMMMVDKKTEITARCMTCLKAWTEVWTLTKITKRNPSGKKIDEEKIVDARTNV